MKLHETLTWKNHSAILILNPCSRAQLSTPEKHSSNIADKVLSSMKIRIAYLRMIHYDVAVRKETYQCPIRLAWKKTANNLELQNSWVVGTNQLLLNMFTRKALINAKTPDNVHRRSTHQCPASHSNGCPSSLGRDLDLRMEFFWVLCSISFLQ